MKKITLLLLLAALCHSADVAAQKTTKLQKGKLYEETISKKEQHTYTYALTENQYLFGLVQQKGIDLAVETFGPDGIKIKKFDSPNGNNGPEYFTIENEQAGTYRIEVKPLNEEGNTVEKGQYTLEVLKVAPRATTKAGKVAQLFAAYDQPNSPGASVAVVQNGEIVYKAGFGSANLEYDIPNIPSTVFHIASISKQFTTFAIAQLVDKGQINLDDDIRKYLPEVPDFGKTITIRHLAHHTSGMRDQWNLLALGGWRLDDVITTEHVLKLVAKQKVLNYQPGEEYLYCNTGFTLMGEIVARVTEQSFADYCAKNIFEPLEMSNTLFYDDHEKIVKNRAYSYGPGKDGFTKRVLSYANAGATSLFTTVEDLSKWALNFENTKVGNDHIMQMMHTKGILNDGEEITYALGQNISQYKGLNRVSHGGADAGYRTYLARFPDQKISVIVFSNLGSFNAGGMASQIADIYLEEA
ncbi:MAG: serine hydrolase domain-containing protein, partial [Bacteroidota bacterium]